jgi:tRNA pseudouridine32 synthase/23S rRNA pseudouridine746 synthase
MATFRYSPSMKPYLEIISQDDAIFVFNKPSGLLSVLGKEHADCLPAPSKQSIPNCDSGTSIRYGDVWLDSDGLK